MRKKNIVLVLFDTIQISTLLSLAPGPPTNFEVIPLPNFGAELHWDNPEVNPACVERSVMIQIRGC